MSDEQTSIDTSGLDNLQKALKENKYVVKVGILGSKNARTGPSTSNATVGAAHEFGTVHLPRRSFLRMPLETEFKKELARENILDEKAINTVIKDVGLKSFTEKLGIIAVATVLKAFNTDGFGTWAPLKPETMEKKEIKQILVETHQLRDSIDYEVRQSK